MIEKLWMMSIQACPLILVTLFMGRMLQKYPKVYSYSLWMLVMVRLLCPVFIESPFSLQPDLSMYLPEQAAEEQEPGTVLEISKEGEFLEKTAADMELEEKEAMALAGRRDFQKRESKALLELLYLTGAAVLVGIYVFQYVQMRRRIAFAVRDRDDIWLCEGISSPFVMGVIKPGIYLPFGLSENEKIYIIRHERMHIRHRDTWVRLAGLAALCLHWWNPLVWYGIHRMFQDMEMYCDEAATEESSLQEKKKYASILLKFAAQESGFTKALSFGDSNTKKRIQNILKEKKKSIAVYLLLLLFVTICTYIFLTVPERRQLEENAKDLTETLPGEMYTLEDMPVPMQEMVLSDASVLSNGVNFHVQLVMTEGEYFTEEYAGTGGGIFEENYSGNYELRVFDEEGKFISKCLVRDEFGGGRFNFGGSFELALADYNGDGCVDFTLGTWGSSSMGLYYLYTVSGGGEISLAYPEGIAAVGLEFSKRFEYAEQGFVVYTYNNAVGEYSRTAYLWEEAPGKYVRGEEVPVPEGVEMP